MTSYRLGPGPRRPARPSSEAQQARGCRTRGPREPPGFARTPGVSPRRATQDTWVFSHRNRARPGPARKGPGEGGGGGRGRG